MQLNTRRKADKSMITASIKVLAMRTEILDVDVLRTDDSVTMEAPATSYHLSSGSLGRNNSRRPTVVFYGNLCRERE